MLATQQPTATTATSHAAVVAALRARLPAGPVLRAVLLAGVLLAAVLLGAGLLGVGRGPAPAAAAASALPAAGAVACAEDGVTVVVDPGALGGAVEQGCAPGAGGLTAAQITEQAGVELAFVPGTTFVCRVEGRPEPDRESCGRTPPADAYWGLFWAEDAGAPWTYATLGATALTVPEGGLLGWRWQDGGDREEPATLREAAPAGTSETDPGDGSAAGPSVSGWAAAGAVVLVGAAVGAFAWRRRR